MSKQCNERSGRTVVLWWPPIGMAGVRAGELKSWWALDDALDPRAEDWQGPPSIGIGASQDQNQN